MRDSDRQNPKGIPPWLGQICGGIAGGSLTWHTAPTVSHAVCHTFGIDVNAASTSTPPSTQVGADGAHTAGLHAPDVLTGVLAPTLGALGVIAGYALGAHNPNKGLLVLAGTVGGGLALKELSNHVHEMNDHIMSLTHSMADPEHSTMSPHDTSTLT